MDEQQLIDPGVIQRFVEYADVQPDETVLEIGPGTGNITKALLEKAGNLICIEKNPKYLPVLRERFSDTPNLKIIKGDALTTYLPNHDRLVSNLPYMVAEPLFQRTLRFEFKSATFIVPEGFAELLQYEAANHRYTKLSYTSQLFYNTQLHEHVPAMAYLPEPNVSTAIISLRPRQLRCSVMGIMIELTQQGDKYTKNGLREALIRTDVCETKNQARGFIDDLDLDEGMQDTRVSRLSLLDLQTLEEKIRNQI